VLTLKETFKFSFPVYLLRFVTETLFQTAVLPVLFETTLSKTTLASFVQLRDSFLFLCFQDLVDNFKKQMEHFASQLQVLGCPNLLRACLHCLKMKEKANAGSPTNSQMPQCSEG